MKGFLKFLGALVTVFSAVIAALTIFDRIGNKNRIKDGYLKCDISDTEAEN